jgi:hypothetical protein
VNLLDNAIGSIKVGVEDAQSGKHERLLSAVRNIHAGILLLYKEALRRLSPPGSNEVLLKETIRPKRDAAGRAPAPLILAVGDPFGICWIGEERWAY